MVTMCKLVSQDMTSRGGMKWEMGKTNRAIGKGSAMCTDGVLHCYKTPEQAALFNPIHAGITNPILLEIDCSELVATDGLKYACKEQTPKRELVLPVFTTTQRVAFAIKLALLTNRAVDFVKWAETWLSGKDRTASAARYAAQSAAAYAAQSAAQYAAQSAARYAAQSAAAYAAQSAAQYAADAAAYAAESAGRSAADAARYAADAARYAQYAAESAGRSAADAARLQEQLLSVINWVINEFEG